MLALLSLCNRLRPPSQGTLLFDLTARTGSWIPVGTDSQIMGTRGICVHDGVLYVLYTVGWWETHLSTYDVTAGTPRLTSDRLLPEVRDPHSVCVHENRLLVASTGTDEIVAYDVSDDEVGEIAETFWRVSDAGADTQHVNSVCSDGNTVVVSAFGPRSGELWSTAENGYIYDITNERTLASSLRHPHSVRVDGERIYYAESSTQTLRTVGQAGIIIGGYVRGCEIAPDGSLLVGSNAARRMSRSKGIVTNSSNADCEDGDVVGKCSLVRVALRERTALRTYYDITPYGKEIYDICVLR
jgi:hypothetical protein